jgi:hypothetical protein
LKFWHPRDVSNKAKGGQARELCGQTETTNQFPLHLFFNGGADGWRTENCFAMMTGNSRTRLVSGNYDHKQHENQLEAQSQPVNLPSFSMLQQESVRFESGCLGYHKKSPMSPITPASAVKMISEMDKG